MHPSRLPKITCACSFSLPISAQQAWRVYGSCARPVITHQTAWRFCFFSISAPLHTYCPPLLSYIPPHPVSPFPMFFSPLFQLFFLHFLFCAPWVTSDSRPLNFVAGPCCALLASRDADALPFSYDTFVTRFLVTDRVLPLLGLRWRLSSYKNATARRGGVVTYLVCARRTWCWPALFLIPLCHPFFPSVFTVDGPSFLTHELRVCTPLFVASFLGRPPPVYSDTVLCHLIFTRHLLRGLSKTFPQLLCLTRT